MEEGTWINGDMSVPNDPQLEDAIVLAIESLNAVWNFENPETGESFISPMCIITLHNRDHTSRNIVLSPSMAAAMSEVLAMYFGTIFGTPEGISTTILDAGIARLLDEQQGRG